MQPARALRSISLEPPAVQAWPKNLASSSGAALPTLASRCSSTALKHQLACIGIISLQHPVAPTCRLVVSRRLHTVPGTGGAMCALPLCQFCCRVTQTSRHRAKELRLIGSCDNDARAKIANWVADYNIRRPPSSLKYLTPAAYAAHLTATDDRLRNPDQLRRSSVAPPAPLGVQNPETLTAAG